jgi:hypothetical protein
MFNKHTSNRRTFDKAWCEHGGTITHVRRTGEARYIHPITSHPVTMNDRRKDVPAKLLSRLNQIRFGNAANDAVYFPEGTGRLDGVMQ